MQTFLKNGYIVSMDQNDTVFDGGGVLVENDRITAVGRVDPAKISPDAEVIDLRGKYVLPGFVNTHVHTSQQISRGVGDDVDFICWLHERMWPFESNMTEEDSYVSTLMTSLELIRSGVTSFAEPGGQFVSGMARATEQSGLRGKLAKSVTGACRSGLACGRYSTTPMSFASAQKSLPTSTASAFTCTWRKQRKKRNTPMRAGARGR